MKKTQNLAAKSLAVRLTRTDNIVDELRTALTPAVTTYKALESTNPIPIQPSDDLVDKLVQNRSHACCDDL
ncbi:MAG: hypothetical protein II388_04320, partial [Clostridia bacterium]|nr:hypothetical protein [Clostridia bacterium]